MGGSFFGQIFKISTFGESHGAAVGVIIDGCPAGLKIYESDIANYLKRRMPISKFSTARVERDNFKILSGIMNDETLGTPICILVENKNFKSEDYDDLKDVFRPGHADLGWEKKFGIRDYRGGGRSSARETVARTIAGSIAKKFLNELGIKIKTYTLAIKNIRVQKFDTEPENNFLFMPDSDAYKKVVQLLNDSSLQNDSVGGIIECNIENVKAGIGEPVFDKLDAQIAKAVMSIGAVKGIEFGRGFESTKLLGSQNNDAYYFEDGCVKKKSNNSGGITGGISDGGQINFRVAIKPTPSISKIQSTVNKQNENVKIKIHGRHDKLIVPRAVVVVESMAAITLMDTILLSCSSKFDSVRKNYFGWE